ncbi:unnamed protein product [Brassica napus]|uniref:(rape) hypothetical protein n=1 Tax=Brassica napus TaxID=3708 RepID=A0A816SFF4_BRANA|nr:unnamed protein product [Brassica napus]
MASILGLGSYLIVNHGDEYWLVRGLYFVVTVVSKVSSFNDTELVWLKRGAFQSVAYRVHWSCFDGELVSSDQGANFVLRIIGVRREAVRDTNGEPMTLNHWNEIKLGENEV